MMFHKGRGTPFPWARFALPTAALWFLAVLAGFGFYVSLVPLPPNDFWWHLKIGELIYTTGTIPATNMFAWTLPTDTPFFYGAWLGQWLLYAVYRRGGVALLLFIRTAMALTAFGLVGAEAKRRSASWRLAAFVLIFACLMTFNNLIVRPQIWSWLPFVFYFVLLCRYADGALRGRWLLLCPLLMVFWVNAHGAFILGLVLLGGFTVGEALRTWFGLDGARSWRAVGWLAAVSGLTGLATLVNPRFVGIVNYVVGLMTNPPSQQLVVEWQSPTPTGIANMAFYSSILVLLLALAYSRYRPTPTEALLLVGFLWLAWSGQRYVVWFGLTMMPLLARALKDLPLRLPAFAPQRNFINVVLAVLLFVPVLLAQPWFVEALPLPEAYWAQVWRDVPEGPLLSVATPLKAAAYLKAHPGGNLFNEMGYGSYLIWALPEQKVFIDPRVELYPYEQWLDYVRIIRGTRYDEILSAYGVDRLLVDVVEQQELVVSLEKDPRWEQEYRDPRTQIWRRQP
ncbi:MAG TPA: hypothetical protein PLJ78_12085 [Anaerolineae bacterium]|nr:hypothetical protein [Anaerolineae bacterium]HQK14668.1 hypothetical protein [Anaerolineae bacterium]